MLFLELAAIATAEFSMESFNKYFSHLIFLFNKEKNKSVALRWAKYATEFREGLGLY